MSITIDQAVALTRAVRADATINRLVSIQFVIERTRVGTLSEVEAAGNDLQRARVAAKAIANELNLPIEVVYR